MLAARRAGMKEVLLPLKNKADFENLPDYIKKD
jgi:ATP-dependent Lon protease